MLLYHVIICCDGSSSLYEQLGRIRHYFEERVFSGSDREQSLTLLETGRIGQISAHRPILILPKALRTGGLTPSDGVFSVIANSDFFAAEELARCFPRAQIITCGLSGGDTVTFSSCGEEQTVVSLQSPMTTVSGRSVLPQEFPIPCSAGTGRFDLLTCSALMLLCDRGELMGELHL